MAKTVSGADIDFLIKKHILVDVISVPVPLPNSSTPIRALFVETVPSVKADNMALLAAFSDVRNKFGVQYVPAIVASIEHLPGGLPNEAQQHLKDTVLRYCEEVDHDDPDSWKMLSTIIVHPNLAAPPKSLLYSCPKIGLQEDSLSVYQVNFYAMTGFGNGGGLNRKAFDAVIERLETMRARELGVKEATNPGVITRQVTASERRAVVMAWKELDVSDVRLRHAVTTMADDNGVIIRDIQSFVDSDDEANMYLGNVLSAKVSYAEFVYEHWNSRSAGNKFFSVTLAGVKQQKSNEKFCAYSAIADVFYYTFNMDPPMAYDFSRLYSLVSAIYADNSSSEMIRCLRHLDMSFDETTFSYVYAVTNTQYRLLHKVNVKTGEIVKLSFPPMQYREPKTDTTATEPTNTSAPVPPQAITEAFRSKKNEDKGKN